MRAETHRDVFEKSKNVYYLSELHSWRSRTGSFECQKEKKNRQQQQTNKQKEKINRVKVFRQSIIIDYLSILYIALGGVSHFDWPCLIFVIIIIFVF